MSLLLQALQKAARSRETSTEEPPAATPQPVQEPSFDFELDAPAEEEITSEELTLADEDLFEPEPEPAPEPTVALPAPVLEVPPPPPPAASVTLERSEAASDGDAVVVAPGTYRERIQLQGKSLTLASRFFESQDPEDIERTILDGGTDSGKQGGPILVVGPSGGEGSPPIVLEART